MERLRLRAPERRTRRRRPRALGDPDLRRTLRRAMRTGRRADRPRLAAPAGAARGGCCWCSTSPGSMSTYSRALAMFAHAALRTGPDWEAFAFGTRLTRMTRALAGPDPDAGLRRRRRAR